MPQANDRNELNELLDRAYGGESVKASTRSAHCLSPMRFLPSVSWTSSESSHVEKCAHCQGMLAAAWETNHPGLKELTAYRDRQSAYPIAMDRHLNGYRCRRCNLVLQVLAAAGQAASHAGMVGRIFRLEDLGFAAAADAENFPARPLISLPAEGSPVEVTLWVEGGDLHIRGLVEKDDVAGKHLAVDLWDDSGSHPYHAPFQPEGEGFAAELRAPLDEKFVRGVRNGGVVVAWVAEEEDWN